ncbi:zinc-finger domain-containing protein [Rhodocyclus tenuis]|uniref:zinc-finger domain-containing protein n=1 Tax=Rhodocyclus tenuis TaxID=1066 RepID=UPI001D17FFEA|nr:zinc-finger domain-containing protein [Rhodocyclus tenuis]
MHLGAGDLPLFCPRPDAPLWARHPRVYLDVTTTGEVVCPYCSAHYLFAGEAPKHH